MRFSFRGGIHPEEKKAATYKKAIEEMKAPAQVIIPLIMHKGAICSPVVEVGEHVRLGQKIAESTSEFSAPIHASVSGTVTKITSKPHPNGGEVPAIVIENDFEDEHEHVGIPYDNFRAIDAGELSMIVREAGIVGQGGSGYPLSEKIRAAEGKVDTLIVNGAECEPYITADNRMMIEYAKEVYDGAVIIAKAVGATNAVVAIESNKPDAIAEMRRALAKKPGVRIAVLHTKYPQGAERQIIRSVTGREVAADKMPWDEGVITINVSTAVATARAVRDGKPLTKRVVTVSGSAIANPKNLLVRIGTTIGDLVEACGGFLDHPERIIMGGPMMGTSQFDLETPVIKGTNAVVALLPKEEKKETESACIHCGKCVSVCPMHLMPVYIHRAYKAGELDECKRLFATDCSECGACSYICPARISLTAELRVVKDKLAKEKCEGEK